jgi:putative acetyltransferase
MSRSSDIWLAVVRAPPQPRRRPLVWRFRGTGRGVGSALMREMIDLCDNWLRVERIELTVFADNAPAIAVYKKYGFEIEGTGKRYALRNGEYVDAYYMARMK